MPEQNDPLSDSGFETRVRETAYFLWENDGRPPGREKDYWSAALERCLREREADGLLKKSPLDDDTQADDNIDDLGRPLNDKGGSLDQPVSGTKKP